MITTDMSHTTSRAYWLGAMAALTILAAVTAFAFAPPTAPNPNTMPAMTAGPLALHSTPIDLTDAIFVHELAIENQDTMARLLYRAGLHDPELLKHFQSDKTASKAARLLRPGQSVRVHTLIDGGFLRIQVPLRGSDDPLVIERSGAKLVSRSIAVKPETEFRYTSGVIDSSLFAATERAQVPDSIAVQLAEIFSGDIDFHRDLRRGDRFAVVYEQLRNEGFVNGTGRVIAADFVNGGREHRAIFFADANGRSGYYDPQGKSMKKAFLRSPLEFSRITSGFSGSRFHPVLQRWRAHTGVDYGAPIGTPVRATANGTVQFSGWQGGYGNLVIVRHTGNRYTAYGHLQRFAKGIRPGVSVEQAQTIGYVGQTGLASGPHLHYEFRIGSRAVNPLTASIPEAPPLSPAQLLAFRPLAEEAAHRLSIASVLLPEPAE